MGKVAKPENYWISPKALNIQLNAMDDADYIQCSVSAGSNILCYIQGVEGLEYDTGHNYKHWPLTISPTYFPTETHKYLYVAIPRTEAVGLEAMVVFPDVKLDIYGCNEAGEQVGDEDKYYIWLQGIISEKKTEGGSTYREWEQVIQTGLLNSDESYSAGGEGTWWSWNPVTDMVTFLKKIAYAVFEYLKADQAEVGALSVTGRSDLNEVHISGSTYGDHFQSSHYTGDGMFDTGFILRYADGHAKMVIDDLVCRGKFVINEIEDRIWTYAGGNMIFSAAGSTLRYVEYLDASGEPMGYTNINSRWLLKGIRLLARRYPWARKKLIQRTLTPEERARVAFFRCYETSDNGTMQTRNWWHIDDIAFCQTLNRVKNKTVRSGEYTGSLSNTVYARRVINIGSKHIEFSDDNKIYDYVDLSLTDCDPAYDDWPIAGDVIVQRGNFTDKSRQGCTTIEVTGDQRGLKVYDNMDSYQKDGWKKCFLGYDADLKRGLLEVFGDCYIGAMGPTAEDVHNGETYVRYNSATHQLDIKAHISASSSIGDEESVDEYIEKVFAPTVVELTEQDLINEQNAKQAQGLAELWGGFATDVIAELNKIKAKGKVGFFDKITIRNFCTSYASYTTAKEQADRYNLDTTALTAAYNANQLAYAKYTADTPAEIPIESDFDAFITFLTVWSNTLVAVANAAKNLATSALSAAQTAQAAADAMNYIKVALKQKTDVEGGLILSSIIALRDGNGTIWSGMNGVYGDGRTIAAWYGGSMTDKEKYPSASRPAQALFRMDGTGYLAGGNISWNSDGSGKVAGGNISWNAAGVVNVTGSNVSAATFTLDGTNITNKLKQLMGMFDLITENGETVIRANYSFKSVGDIWTPSDRRLKKITESFTLDVEVLAGMSVIRYTRTDLKDGRQRVGGIAQEWQKVLPEAVREEADSMLSVDYDAIDYAGMVSLARKVVEQQKEIDELKERLGRMESMVLQMRPLG